MLSLAVLTLVGCAGTDKKETFESVVIPEEGKGAVYLYRSNMYDLREAAPVVFLDGEPEGQLLHATYKLWHLEEGEHEVSVKVGDFFDELFMLEAWEIRERKVTVDVEPGAVYFLRLKPTVRNNTLGWRDAKLTLVDEADALKEITTNTLSE